MEFFALKDLKDVADWARMLLQPLADKQLLREYDNDEEVEETMALDPLGDETDVG